MLSQWFNVYSLNCRSTMKYENAELFIWKENLKEGAIYTHISEIPFFAQTFLNESRPQNMLPKHRNAIISCELMSTIGSILCNTIGNACQSSWSTLPPTSEYAIPILSLNSHGINVNEDDHPNCTSETANKIALLFLWAEKSP